MRGRVRNAAADRKIIVAQRGPSSSHVAMGEAWIVSAIAPGPPVTPQTTKMPTASRATSFTTASTAMAVTTP